MGKGYRHRSDHKRRAACRVRVAEYHNLVVWRRSAGQDEPPRRTIRWVLPLVLGAELRGSRYWDLFVRGAGAPGSELGWFCDHGRRREGPGVVDVDGVVQVLCSKIVGYLRHDEDGFAGRSDLRWRGTKKRDVVKHGSGCPSLVVRETAKYSTHTLVMLWTTSCRRPSRCFNPWLGRTHSRSLVQTSRNLFPRISRHVSGRAVDPSPASPRLDNVRTFCERVSRPPIRKQVAVRIQVSFARSLSYLAYSSSCLDPGLPSNWLQSRHSLKMTIGPKKSRTL